MDGRIRPVRRRVGARDQSSPVRVVPLRKEGAFWALRLSGAVNTVLEYDGRKAGREVVRLGNAVVAQASTFGGYNRRFELQVASAVGPLPLVLEVRVSLWHAIESVTLRCNGHTLYHEQTCRALEPGRPPLPIPIETPALSSASLPRPLPALLSDPRSLPLAGPEEHGPVTASPAGPPPLPLPRRPARAVAALLALAGGFLS